MNIIKLEENVAIIREKIYSYDIANIQNEVLVLVEEFSNLTNSLNTEKLGYRNDILNYLMTAFSNKDYLVLGDILKYELLPMISERVNGELI